MGHSVESVYEPTDIYTQFVISIEVSYGLVFFFKLFLDFPQVLKVLNAYHQMLSTTK